MGIIISIPQIDGLAISLLPLSSTSSSTSYAFDPIKSSALTVSTAKFNQSNTRVTSISAVPVVQTSFTRTADVTDDMLVDDPTSPGFATTTTRYIHTVTVTSKVKSTNSVTATATVAASYCPTTTIKNTMQSVPSTRVYTTGTVEKLIHSRLPAVSSHLSIHFLSRLSENRGLITHTSVLRHSRLPATVVSHYGTFSPNRLAGSGAESASQHPIASMSQFDRKNIAIRGTDDTSSESKDKPLAIGPSIEITNHEKVTRRRPTLTVPSPHRLESTTTLTKIRDVTTITVYTNAITNHTTTTTVTTFPISCPTSTTSTSSSTSSNKSCASATPNPNPPANHTCAEDGLLEYSNTPQPPDTLEGCAVACLADARCLSFTFIPGESKCYTSLYPLADSAFAGTQQYHIYNYDRDCYSCSS